MNDQITTNKTTVPPSYDTLVRMYDDMRGLLDAAQKARDEYRAQVAALTERNDRLEADREAAYTNERRAVEEARALRARLDAQTQARVDAEALVISHEGHIARLRRPAP